MRFNESVGLKREMEDESKLSEILIIIRISDINNEIISVDIGL